MNNGREDKLPWVKWYWSDWLSAHDLRACSLAARGLWIEMLAIMARSSKKGLLLANEKPMDSKTLAKIVSESPSIVEGLLRELYDNGVYSTLPDGTIINRRLYRESELSQKRADAGRLGGLRGKQIGSKEGEEGEANEEQASASASSSLLSFNKNLKSWEGITDDDKAGWLEAYPACNIDIELSKMKEWIMSNPAKGKKSNYRRFITNWLSRTQDKGGTKGAVQDEFWSKP
jgi:hypothetical protein